MAYSTTSQVRARNSLILTESAVSDAQVIQYIAQADGKINSYLIGGGYSLPLSSIPDEIVGYSADMAASFAIRDAVGSTGTDEVAEQARVLYNDTIAALRDIAKGLADLGISSTTTTASRPAPGHSNQLSRTRKWNRTWDPRNPSTIRSFPSST